MKGYGVLCLLSSATAHDLWGGGTWRIDCTYPDVTWQVMGGRGVPRYCSGVGEVQSKVWDSQSWLGVPGWTTRLGLSGSHALGHPSAVGCHRRAEIWDRREAFYRRWGRSFSMAPHSGSRWKEAVYGFKAFTVMAISRYVNARYFLSSQMDSINIKYSYLLDRY